MEYINAFDAQASFDSLNGGIQMWLGRLADTLAESGTFEVLKRLEAEISRTQDSGEKADLYELDSGLKNLDQTTLEEAVAEAKKHFHPMSAFQVRFQQCYEKLEEFEKKWHVAAKSTEHQLAIWGAWACARKAKSMNRLFPCDIPLLKLRISFEFTCRSDTFNSPTSFEANLDRFKEVVAAIRKEIPDGYRADDLPEALDPLAFNKTVDALKELLVPHKDILRKEEEIRQKLLSLEARYASAKQQLIGLLTLMPEAAKLALFGLMRPDVHMQAAA